MSESLPFGLGDAFLVLRRDQGPAVEVITGEAMAVTTMAEVEELRRTDEVGEDLVVVVPYRQLRERGFDCHDDEQPICLLRVRGHQFVPVDDFRAALPRRRLPVGSGAFAEPDHEYASGVVAIMEDAIASGEGANFVIRRSYDLELPGFDAGDALQVFAELVEHERGSHWTFALVLDHVILVGASPELHLGISGGRARMNPISGTLRHRAGPASPAQVSAFLRDAKESDELSMVLDEELKMMTAVCDGHVCVTGPFLRRMSTVTHSEFFIEGPMVKPAIHALRRTLFAPTVTGSPLRNATRVIARHESRPRGYYSGVIALVGQDEDGMERLDSAILIRTAEIDRQGRGSVGVGSTLVRHSDPMSEVAETAAKAAPVLSALGLGAVPASSAPASTAATRVEHLPELELAARRVSSFWRGTRPPLSGPPLEGTALVLDAEDDFTAMLAEQLGHLGLEVDVNGADPDPDLLVLGPGPGDPRDLADPRIRRLRRAAQSRLLAGRPMLAVCLGHEVVAHQVGLSLMRLDRPMQGERREVEVFGQRRDVGYYCSFVARRPESEVARRLRTVGVQVDLDGDHVVALRGPTWASVQFHPESVLTSQGVAVLEDAVRPLLGPRTGVVAGLAPGSPGVGRLLGHLRHAGPHGEAQGMAAHRRRRAAG